MVSKQKTYLRQNILDINRTVSPSGVVSGGDGEAEAFLSLHQGDGHGLGGARRRLTAGTHWDFHAGYRTFTTAP